MFWLQRVAKYSKLKRKKRERV